MIDGFMILGIIGFFVLVLLYVIGARELRREAAEAEQKRQEMIAGFTKGSMVLTPQGFFDYRKIVKERKLGEITGVYVLHNRTKDMCYVGQSTKVYQRVANHFSGRGNADVYADYKYGDDWTIRLVRLSGSEFDSLDALERHAIQLYDSYHNGYNKTRGNR